MMTLFVTPTSPYVRQCRIVLRERGLTGMILESPISLPAEEDDTYLSANPSGHGPALIAPEATLIGAPLICAYLDQLGDGLSLTSTNWASLAREALAQAATEFAVRLRERPDKNLQAALFRTLGRLERDTPEAPPFDLASIASAVAVRYISLRHPQIDWRFSHDNLANLADELEQRESFRATAPPS